MPSLLYDPSISLDAISSMTLSLLSACLCEKSYNACGRHRAVLPYSGYRRMSTYLE